MAIRVLIFFISLYGFIGAELAQGDIDSAKLFRLNVDGKISYLLATDHYFTNFSDPDIALIKTAIASSSEIVLESNGTPQSLEAWTPGVTDFGPKPDDLRRKLSPGALKAFRDLSGDLPSVPLLSLKAGAFLSWAREAYAEMEGKLFERYWAEASHLSESQLARRFGDLRVAPQLIKAADLVFEKRWSAEDLTSASFNYMMSKEESEIEGGLDTFVEQEAKAKDRSIFYLDSVEKTSESQVRVNAVTVQDLNRALTKMGESLKEQNMNSRIFNLLIRKYIYRTNSNRFFSQDIKSEAAIERLIFDPSHGNQGSYDGGLLLFPGEEAVRKFRTNRHDEWHSTLLQKLKSGGLFIAVGASHVLPGLDKNISSETLIDTFLKSGIQVTPISSRQPKALPLSSTDICSRLLE